MRPLIFVVRWKGQFFKVLDLVQNPENSNIPLCVSLIVGKSPSKSEHFNGKTATNVTFSRYNDDFTQKDALLSARSFKVLLWNKMFKKVPKVAVLRFTYSDL